MRRQITHAPARTMSRKRTLAAVVLTPWLALQGCAKNEEQTTGAVGTSSVGQQKRFIRTGTNASAEVLRTEDGAEYVAGQLVVRFKTGTSTTLTSSTHLKLGAKVLRTYRMQPELQVVQVDEASLRDALEAYRADPRVDYAEPNFVYRISTLPNDTRFGELWGMHNTGQSAGTPDVDINAPEAWDLTTGSDTASVVTVIDTGVDYTHPDLTANMWVNPGEIAGNGLDDDANGYIDDVHGINAITGTGDPKDDHAHGTHVSGTIAGRGNNSLGVAGVNWTAKVMGCKFLDAAGSGSLDDALTCLDYVHMMKTRATNPVNIIATSNSWGGGSYSQAMYDSLAVQREDGTLFVAAAGNDALNNDTATAPSYPASYFLSNVISVAAHDRTDKLATFSTYGRRTVHVAAPGVSILSSVLGGSYSAYDGTSMATPHVSGLVALLKAQDPSRDWKQLKNLVLTGAVNSTGAVGKTLTGKRLRAADTGGKGSLTCADQVLNTRVRPIASTVNVTLQQQPVQLIAYNIKCDAPNGAPTVTVMPGGGTITLTDTGMNGDQTAGDGLYTGSFEPQATGTHTLTFPDGETLTVNATSGYVENPEPFAWRTITGTNLNLTDDSVATITSPFGIPFGGGTAVTSLTAGMNGGLRTGSNTAFTYSNVALPYTSYTSLVAPFWDDLFPGPTAADNVFWAVTGTAPNRELVVEWRNVHHRTTRTVTPADTVNFQVVFFEGKPDILYNYKDVVVGNTSYDKGASATVGVQVNATNATQRSLNTASLENGTSIRWTIPAPATAPVVSAVTASPTTLAEGDSLDLSATFSDPDGDSDAPYRVDFDLNYGGATFTVGTSETASTPGTVTTSTTVGSSGTVKVAARAVDRRGTRSAVMTAPETLTVTDVVPVLSAITVPETLNEKQAGSFSTFFTDPGLDAPWRVQWDWNYDGATFAPDETISVTKAGPVAVSHAFPQDGTYSVAVRVTDKDGVLSNLQVVTVNVADLRPVLDPITTPAAHIKESQTLEFSAKFTDPGDHSKPWRVQWDYSYDGTTFNVESETSVTVDGVQRGKSSMQDSGSFTYAMRVVDADGSMSDVQTLDVVVDEVHPVLSEYTARPLSKFEGEPRTVAFSLKSLSGADDAGMDPVRSYLWDFDGDGTFDYLSYTPDTIFTYRNNPAGGDTYTAIVRVEDEDTYSEARVSVVVRNVAPTLATLADQGVNEGRMLITRAQASDPGNDAFSFSLSGAPEGMSITSDGLIVWSPSSAQAGEPSRAYAVTVTVTDEDGASSSQVVTFTARNVAPTLAAIASRTVNEGSQLSVRAQATDSGNGTLSYSLSGAPEGMSITA
ncbi:MAG TPA: S8 family serine peptidase, partial [Archangium sp.]|uniref:S8 family serine peptidase n=1 Tax=Archangium sp. TaxID=1872627 RepID=UPI002EDAE79E